MSKTKRRNAYDDDAYEARTLSFLPVCDDYRHLVCVPYSIENLHKTAKELGIGESWFHSGRLPHYDIPKKRRDEIESLCMRVDARRIVKIIKGIDI